MKYEMPVLIEMESAVADASCSPSGVTFGSWPGCYSGSGNVGGGCWTSGGVPDFGAP